MCFLHCLFEETVEKSSGAEEEGSSEHADE
jgi:hypothetical protein